MVKRKKHEAYYVNKFKARAEELRNTVEDEAELNRIKWEEDEFYEALDDMVKHKEIIIGQYNAKMRLGKSTVAIKTGSKIFDSCKKYYPEQAMSHQEFGTHNIFGDQDERSQAMDTENLQYTVTVTDEKSKSADTGINATVEKARQQDQSNIQAGLYVHSINCSPAEIIDDNTDLLMEVLATNRETQSTRCLIKYKILIDGSTYFQPIGYVDIYVGDIISNWVKHIDPVWGIFIKKPNSLDIRYNNKAEKVGSPEHKKFVQHCEEYNQVVRFVKNWARKDYYILYNMKKYFNIKLPKEKGISSSRSTKYAKPILELYRTLEILLKGRTKKIDKTVLTSSVRRKMREYKFPTSLVAEEIETRNLISLLEYDREINSIKKELVTLKVKLRKTEDYRVADEIEEQIGLKQEQVKYWKTLKLQEIKDYEVMIDIEKEKKKILI